MASKAIERLDDEKAAISDAAAVSIKRLFAGLAPAYPATPVDNGQMDSSLPDGISGHRRVAMAVAGYARISTAGQTVDLQTDALAEAGCDRVFSDQASGAASARPGLDRALEWLREGEVLVALRLDRLGRSMPHLVETVRDLQDRGVGFRSLTEGIDTTTPTGTLVFHIFGALAQFERDLIRERTAAGLTAARARGRKGGRRPVVTPARLKRAQDLIGRGASVRETAAVIGVSKSALYNALGDSSRQPDQA